MAKRATGDSTQGGGMWSSFTLDAARGVLYVPAGNPAPDFLPKLRSGANLYTNSVIALDARKGRFLTHVQPVKDDFHDWDVSATPALFTSRGGRSLLALAGKDGLAHGIDRAGEKLTIRYSVPTTTRTNVDVPLTQMQGTRFCPGTQGGTEWNGPAYNPDLNLLFVGAVDWCTSIQLIHPDHIKLALPKEFTGASAAVSAISIQRSAGKAGSRRSTRILVQFAGSTARLHRFSPQSRRQRAALS